MVRTSERRVRLALAVLLVLGAWPWLATLGFWPMAPDSGLWISRGAPTDPDWVSWVFWTRHFHVGYRPVTALSYTLDFLVGGLRPSVYRATDLALHLGAALAVYSLFRRVFRDVTPWAAVLAAGLFLAHPAVEQAVPFIARRSYPLSTLLALSGLAVWLGPPGRPSGPTSVRPLCAGLLLALALLSNEVAILPICVLPLLAWVRATPDQGRLVRVVRSLLAPGILLAGALVLRLWVVGGIGGYESVGEERDRFLPVLGATWRAAAGLPTPMPEHGWPWHWILLATAAPYYLVRCWRGPAELTITGLWIVGASVLFAAQHVWFPRQGYVFAAPVALVVARALLTPRASAGTAFASRLALVPQALLIGGLLAGSAVVFGPHPQRTLEWVRRNALIDDMLAQFGALDDGADVQTVLPFRRADEAEITLKGAAARKSLPRGARQPVTWVKFVLAERDLRIQEYAYVLRDEFEVLAAAALDTSSAPPTLVLPGDREYSLRRGARWVPFEADAPERLAFTPPRPEPERELYVYLGTVDGGTLVRVGP